MFTYHKINSIFKRDKQTNKMILGDFSTPELEYLSNSIWTFDEKVDGTNIRVIFDGNKVSFGGRKDTSIIPQHLLDKLKSVFTLEKLKNLFPNLSEGSTAVLIGEGYGEKIQKVGKHYDVDFVDFILFDVNIGGIYLLRDAVEDIANTINIKFTPIYGEGTVQDAIDIVTKGIKSPLGQLTSEGFILRPKIPMFDRMRRRIITKIKHKDFKHLYDIS